MAKKVKTKKVTEESVQEVQSAPILETQETSEKVEEISVPTEEISANMKFTNIDAREVVPMPLDLDEGSDVVILPQGANSQYKTVSAANYIPVTEVVRSPRERRRRNEPKRTNYTFGYIWNGQSID